MLLEKLKQMNSELDQLKAKHLEMSKTMFHEVSAMLFEKHPVLESFGWRQYTPYFNDGDECTFSAHTSDPDINGYNSDYEKERTGVDVLTNSHKFITEKMLTEEDVAENLATCKEAGRDYYKDSKIGSYGVRRNPNYVPEHGEVVSDVKAFLNEIDESVLRNMFGDHVQVTVSRSGVEVDEFEHD